MEPLAFLFQSTSRPLLTQVNNVLQQLVLFVAWPGSKPAHEEDQGGPEEDGQAPEGALRAALEPGKAAENDRAGSEETSPTSEDVGRTSGRLPPPHRTDSVATPAGVARRAADHDRGPGRARG